MSCNPLPTATAGLFGALTGFVLAVALQATAVTPVPGPTAPPYGSVGDLQIKDGGAATALPCDPSTFVGGIDGGRSGCFVCLAGQVPFSPDGGTMACGTPALPPAASIPIHTVATTVGANAINWQAYVINASAGATVVNLVDCSLALGLRQTFTRDVLDVSSNPITLTPSAGQLINAASTFVLPSGAYSVTVLCGSAQAPGDPNWSVQ